jgi:putative transposase
MSKRNNQNFVNIPHAQLIDYITYRAAKYGIMVVLQEESYTSKADLIAKDFMPVYGQEKGKPKFSGVRAERGTYSCSNGLDINADCNGAGNILRKAIPTAWDQVTDYRFMATPVSIKFTDFMPNYNMDPA